MTFWKPLLHPTSPRTLSEYISRVTIATAFCGLAYFADAYLFHPGQLNLSHLGFFVVAMFLGMACVCLPKTHPSLRAISGTAVATVLFVCVMTAISPMSLSASRIGLFAAVAFAGLYIMYAVKRHSRRNTP